MSRYEMSIEITGGEAWQHAYGDVLTATAVEHGAEEWRWLHRTWGVVLEIAFKRESQYDLWRSLPSVTAAFDAAPGRVIFHRGWGGTSGSRSPRRPRPLAGAGAAELEFERDRIIVDAAEELVVTVTDGDDVRTAAAI